MERIPLHLKFLFLLCKHFPVRSSEPNQSPGTVPRFLDPDPLVGRLPSGRYFFVCENKPDMGQAEGAGPSRLFRSAVGRRGMARRDSPGWPSVNPAIPERSRGGPWKLSAFHGLPCASRTRGHPSPRGRRSRPQYLNSLSPMNSLRMESLGTKVEGMGEKLSRKASSLRASEYSGSVGFTVRRRGSAKTLMTPSS